MFKRTFPFVTVSARLRNILAGLVFWSWNALCLSLVLFGFVPHVLPELLRETTRGLIPWSMTLAAFCLVGLPLVATAWGIRNFRRPRRQLALFYGLEVPLVLFCLFRIFLVRELAPGLAFVIVAFFVACVAFGFELHRERTGPRWEQVVRLTAQSMAALTSLYLGTILAFYVPVLAVALLEGFFTLAWPRALLQIAAHGGILACLAALLVTVSAALFLAAPIALIGLHLRTFQRVLAGARGLLGRKAAYGAVAGTAVVCVGLFVLLNHQPQHRAFSLLARPPASDGERERLLASAGDLRAGLLAAYLAPYRFLSSREQDRHLEGLYRHVLRSPQGLARVVASGQKALLAPLLYDGSTDSDGARAEMLYAQFFDAPLQRKERVSVLTALAATWNQDERSAGLLNQDQRQVKLVRQELRVDERDGVASVEIHDEYENQTYDTQEIFLAFSLPEGAAVTGLWLGDSEDRDQRFVFQVSPRGAAQAVYRGEVTRGSDPALVEQTGPGQYRLRAFPVPAKSRETDRAPAFHLWLTYTAMADHGQWPTPRLLERRNLYWDLATVRRHGEQVVRREQPEWVGIDLPAPNRPNDEARQAVLPGGYVVRRELRPQRGMPAITGQRLAVVVDRSYSMNEVRAELRATLSEVARLGHHNDVDVYLTSAASRGEPALRVDDPGTALDRPLLCFGGGNLQQWLRQLEDLRGDTRYDGIFVLTDGDSFDNADDSQAPAALGAPVWIVHLGGRLAAGYDDRMLDLLNRSQGGAATTLEDALHRFAARRVDAAIINVEGEHQWTLHKAEAPASPIDDFARLAARQLILALDRDRRDIGLDAIHRIAIAYQQVSAFSSMIVLVEDRQRQALAAAEGQADRFEREVESGREVLQKPSKPLAFGATPEPHEWVLIGLAAAAVIVVLRQRRRTMTAAG